MNLTTSPYNWNSLWRPIEYVYDYESAVTNSITTTGGYATFNFAAMPAGVTPAVGDKLIVESSVSTYYGIHEITSVTSSLVFVTGTPFVGGAGAVTTLFAILPEIKLYKGYATGEAFDAEDPLTLVATFKPKNSIYNDIRIDVSGYLQGVFTIAAPTAGVDHNMFTRFRLYFDGAFQRYYHVLNSALESVELEGYYANTGRYLVNTATPYLLDCGTTLLSRIENNAVINYEYAEVLSGSEFDTDFDADFE